MDKPYMLISVTERDITTSKYKTYEDAFAAMFAELKECPDWSNGWEEDYESEKDDKGYYEDGSEFGISENSAWANADGGDMNCDWLIVNCADK